MAEEERAMAMASRLVATLARQASSKQWRGDLVKLRSCHVLPVADEMFQAVKLPESKVSSNNWRLMNFFLFLTLTRSRWEIYSRLYDCVHWYTQEIAAHV